MRNLLKPPSLRFLVIVFSFAFTHATELKLLITSVNGEQLKQVGVGQPFVVEVVLNGAQAEKKSGTAFFSRGATPRIKGLDAFNARFVGTSMNMINGIGSMTYRYRARIDTLGGHHIGPATLEHNQQKFSSNKLEITVADQEAPLVNSSAQKKNQAAVLVASVDKKKIMLGENLVYTLRYYYADNTVQLKAIVPPKLSEVNFGKARGPVEGQEVFNGQHYYYAQWQWDVYPTQAGKMTIPAAAADVDVLDTSHALSVLSAFLGGTTQQKQLFSQAVTVQVDPLPAYHEKVDAIGLFTSLHATVDQTTVKEGEGFVYTLELAGEGNIEHIALLVLKNIPDAFKWYDSKNYMVDTAPGKPRRRKFEYIMQGLQSGAFQIPAQKFTYFDSEKHVYKTIQSAPIDIKVQQTALSKKRSAVQEKFSAHKEKKNTPHLLALAPIDRMLPYTQWRMPGWLLVIILIILCLIGGILFFPFAQRLVYMQKLRTRNPFDQARADLKKVEHEQSYEKIYRIFIELCATQWQISAELVPEKMNNYVRGAGWHAEKIAAFDEFMMLLAGAAYAQLHHADIGKKIIEQAYAWLAELEKI